MGILEQINNFSEPYTFNSNNLLNKIHKASESIFKRTSRGISNYCVVNGFMCYVINRTNKRLKNNHRVNKILNKCEMKHQPLKRMYENYKMYNEAKDTDKYDFTIYEDFVN